LQLGAVILQDNKPIAFYSWKLNPAQTRYTTTKHELLSIVETLKRVSKHITWSTDKSIYWPQKSHIHQLQCWTGHEMLINYPRILARINLFKGRTQYCCWCLE
jgi:hypothetical protein